MGVGTSIWHARLSATCFDYLKARCALKILRWLNMSGRSSLYFEALRHFLAVLQLCDHLYSNRCKQHACNSRKKNNPGWSNQLHY
jgi:hypothetical protein